MSSHRYVAAAISIALGVLALSTAEARTISFEERVRAQEAIERAYYSHQLDATLPFAEAVPRALLEGKVRTYLAQSAALAERWHTPITAEMLEREVARMARGSRIPERLAALFHALDDDAFLVQECLARQVLANRFSRSHFASDATIHRDTRERAERLWNELRTGALDPFASHPARHVVVIARQDEASPTPSMRAEIALDAEEFARWRAAAPGNVGEIGLLNEERDAFVIRVVLEEQAKRARIATFRIDKRGWNSWWADAVKTLDLVRVAAVAQVGNSLPAVGTRAGSAPLGQVPCDEDAWINGSLTGSPIGRHEHSAVWTGSEMIVWGGSTQPYGHTQSGGRYDPVTDSWTPTSLVGAPSARGDHQAVWTGSEMIIWGGYDGTYLNSGARYDPSNDEWMATSIPASPLGRIKHTAVWTGSEMIVWGGGTGSGFTAAGGRYDPVADTWTSTASSGAPTARWEHSAVWTGSEMILWGGNGLGAADLDSGARYDPSSNTWTTLAVTGAPSPRSRHTAVWTGSRMIVWGGWFQSTSSALQTGSIYDPVADAWSPVSLVGVAGARSGHTAVWTGSQMIIWGAAPDSKRYDPVTNTWSPVSTAGAPVSRFFHTAIWSGSEMIVWGGFSYGVVDYANTGGRYDPASDTWTATDVNSGAPVGRAQHSAVWTGNLMVVWGGASFDGYEQSGGRYDPAVDAWTPTSLSEASSNRTAHTAVWTGDRMIVWGGVYHADDTDQYETAMGQYDVVADSWTTTSTIGSPPGRRDHTAVWSGSRMIVWGGRDASGYVGSGGRYDPLANAWLPTTPVGAPAARADHTAVWTGNQLIVWGGIGGSYLFFNDGGRYDPGSDTWTPTTTASAPGGRDGHSAVWMGSEMIVWGGHYTVPASPTAQDFWLNNGGRYAPLTDTWSALATDAAPTARYRHTAVWTGSRMVVWGGGQPYVFPTDGGVYDPTMDQWTPTSLADAPGGRWLHTALWAGTQMIVWGGVGETAFGNGGRYFFAVDTDGDGTNDGCDNCAAIANSNQADADADGFGDVCDECPLDVGGSDPDGDGLCGSDNCPSVANASQANADGDAFGDACDVCPLDPVYHIDADQDGVCGTLDNCPSVFNPDQANADGDSRGDTCDNCPNDPADDADSDTVCGDVDNCPSVVNPSQLDSDRDALGDACDACPADATNDADSDGICGGTDNCPFAANPDQTDSDAGTTLRQWAVSAMASSEFAPDLYSAAQATGAPDSPPACVDAPTRWAPAEGETAPEWLEVAYATSVRAIGVRLRESSCACTGGGAPAGGFVQRIELREPGGALHTIWQDTDVTACGEEFAPSWPATPYEVAAVRVHTQIADYEEIDAVELIGLVTNPVPAPDGVGDACDNCPTLYNPGQERLVFGEWIVAADRETLGWSIASDVDFVRGLLASVPTYGYVEGGTLNDALALGISAYDPAPGAAFYYLFRLAGSCGSWQSMPGAEPGRDAALP